jgi:hypothetical protein
MDAIFAGDFMLERHSLKTEVVGRFCSASGSVKLQSDPLHPTLGNRPRIGDVAVMPRYADFKVLLRDIQHFGRYVPAQIAKQLNVAPTTLYTWIDGAEPRWSSGDAIWRMHERVCGVQITELRNDEFKACAKRHP